MSKEKQKFFRLSAFNCDRSQGPNPLSPRGSGDHQPQPQQPPPGNKKPKHDPNSIRLGVKVSKLSDTSDDDDEDDNNAGAKGAHSAGAGASGGLASKKQNGDANERLSDSSSSCSTSNDSLSSSDSGSDDDSSDDSDDSSSLSSNSSLSSSHEPDAGGAKPSGSGGGAGGGTSGKGSGDKLSSKKGSLPFDSAVSASMGKKAASNGSTQSRGSFSFTDFSAKTEADGGVWGFAAEAKKSTEIFANPSPVADRIFGDFGPADTEGASGSKTPVSCGRGRKALPREVMKETRNTFSRDFSSPDDSSAVKRRVARAQSDSNNNTNSSKKAVATETAATKRKVPEVQQTATTTTAATPKTTGAAARAALNERSAANDNFATPSGSGSRAKTATSSPPYSINGQNSIGKDAVPYIHTPTDHLGGKRYSLLITY